MIDRDFLRQGDFLGRLDSLTPSTQLVSSPFFPQIVRTSHNFPRTLPIPSRQYKGPSTQMFSFGIVKSLKFS
jgi:hypothetical protein